MNIYRYTFETKFDDGTVLCSEFPATDERMAWEMYKILADAMKWTGTTKAEIAYSLQWL